MLGIPNNAPNIALTNRAVAFNDARLDRLEKMVSSIGAKNTITFVPTKEMYVIESIEKDIGDGQTTTEEVIYPAFIAKSPVRSINKIDSVNLYTTGSDDLIDTIKDQLDLEDGSIISISIHANLLPFNLTNTTTVLKTGKVSNGFYFMASAYGNSIKDISSTYLGGTPISMLQPNQIVWISESLAERLFTDTVEAVQTQKIAEKSITVDSEGIDGYTIKVGLTDSLFENTLIMCRTYIDPDTATNPDTVGPSSIVVEYE